MENFQGLYYFMLIVVESSHTLTPAGTISNTSVTPAGSISNTDITPAGTIGTHSLTVAELPAHSHGRGTTEITGGSPQIIFSDPNSSKALTTSGSSSGQVQFNASGSFYRAKLSFKASSGWAGTSESKGSGTAHGHSWTGTKNTHNHTFTGTAANHNHTFIGTQATINHMNPYIVAYCYRRIS